MRISIILNPFVMSTGILVLILCFYAYNNPQETAESALRKINTTYIKETFEELDYNITTRFLDQAETYKTEPFQYYLCKVVAITFHVAIYPIYMLIDAYIQVTFWVAFTHTNTILIILLIIFIALMMRLLIFPAGIVWLIIKEHLNKRKQTITNTVNKKEGLSK